MKTTILFALAFAAFQMSAQTQPPNKPNTSYSAGTKEDLSRFAGQMLDDTNRARAALKKGDHQLAREDVNRARTELQKIEADAHGATMIPVYQEFVSISILSPVRAEQNARAQGNNAERKGAESSKPAAVNEVAGDYTRVMVSTTVARNGIDAARAALDQREWKKADLALSDVQEGVQIESVESDMPLARTRENLILARAAIRDGHYHEAKAALENAAKALSQYEDRGGRRASEAKQMEEEVNQLAQNLEKEHTGAVSAINKWWNTTATWSPYDRSQTSASR
jgi:hypothetical protein